MFGLFCIGMPACQKDAPVQQEAAAANTNFPFGEEELVYGIVNASFGKADLAATLSLLEGLEDVDRLRSDLRGIRWEAVPSVKKYDRDQIVWDRMVIEVDAALIKAYFESVREYAARGGEPREACLQLLSLVDSVYASVLLSSKQLVERQKQWPMPGNGPVQHAALWRLGIQGLFDELGPDAAVYLLTQQQRDDLMKIAKAGEVKDLRRVP